MSRVGKIGNGALGSPIGASGVLKGPVEVSKALKNPILFDPRGSL